MPAPRTYDYKPIYERYVQGDQTLSDLAREFGIKSPSTLTRRAAKEGWEARRQEFRRQVDNKSLEAVADKRAAKIADIHMDALEVIHAGILKVAEDMQAKEPVMDGGQVLRDPAGNVVYRALTRYNPRDLAILIEKVLVLTGQPSDINENRQLGINLNAATDGDALRELLNAIRPRAALAGPGAGAPGPDTSLSRSD
jgi:transposase-like protein